MKKVAIKYCGGCNPRYNRRGLVDKIIDKYKNDFIFEPVNMESKYAAVIIIDGCSSCCVDSKIYESLGKVVVLCDDNDFIKADDILSKI